jgi:DNA polymerase/3'-5' exonuclease PolX
MDSYTDDKGRLRWRENDEIGEKLKELHDLLVIGGYPPDHAARYPKLAKIVAGILSELIETGDCTKAREPSEGHIPPPRSVLELTRIPGLGAKMARTLYAEHGITGLSQCQEALESGLLDAIAGLGPKLREKIKNNVL